MATENQKTNDFICKKPEDNSFAVSQEGLSVGNRMTINGKDNLSSIISFRTGGYVSKIELVSNNSIEGEEPDCSYAYRIWITGAGPKKGSGYLVFTDRTGDYYRISLTSTIERRHYLRYNSSKPEIIAVQWSDDGL